MLRPSLTIHKAHEESDEHKVAWTIWVGNDGNAPTHSPYTVVDTLPDGVVATSVEGGRRWHCDIDGARAVVTCHSQDSIAPGGTSDPITLHTVNNDKDACLLVNIAAVSSDHFGSDLRLTKDLVHLPCHRDDDRGGVNVNVNVTGNNNGGAGGNSSGATANDNGHVHGVTGGVALADARTASKAASRSAARSSAKAAAWAKAHGRGRVVHHGHPFVHRPHKHVFCHPHLRRPVHVQRPMHVRACGKDC